MNACLKALSYTRALVNKENATAHVLIYVHVRSVTAITQRLVHQ